MYVAPEELATVGVVHALIAESANGDDGRCSSEFGPGAVESATHKQDAHERGRQNVGV